jgi:hypothetical protein
MWYNLAMTIDELPLYLKANVPHSVKVVCEHDWPNGAIIDVLTDLYDPLAGLITLSIRAGEEILSDAPMLEAFAEWTAHNMADTVEFILHRRPHESPQL